MSEGEFKKRLNRVHTEYTSDPPYKYYQGVHTTKEIENMLEEAKKEFPDVIEPFPTVQGALLYAKRVKEWRQRWFGK